MHCGMNELSRRVKLSIYCLNYVLTLTLNLWSQAVSSDRKNLIADTSGQNKLLPQGSWAQCYRVRSSDIQEDLGVELLLLCNEGSKLRWFGPHSSLLGKVFWACRTGRTALGRCRICYRDYVFQLAKDRLWHPLRRAGECVFFILIQTAERPSRCSESVSAISSLYSSDINAIQFLQ